MTRGGGGALPPYPDIPSEMERKMEFDAILTNAHFMFEPHPHLVGNIWQDKKGRFQDGDTVHTSQLVGHFGRGIFATKNSRYLVIMER